MEEGNVSNGLKQIAEIVLHHHERWDGKGYPYGLRDDRIPLGSRIIGVTDAIDAITSIRPYRKALSWDECRREKLQKNLGKNGKNKWSDCRGVGYGKNAG